MALPGIYLSTLYTRTESGHHSNGLANHLVTLFVFPWFPLCRVEADLLVTLMYVYFCYSYPLVPVSRRSRIFLKREPLSCEVPSRRDSVRGGGSSRILPWSPKAGAISVGEG